MTRREITAAVAVTVLSLLGACTAESSDETEGSPSPTRDASDARADATVLADAALPADWRAVPAADRLEGGPGSPRYCGVSAEPVDVVEGRIAFYEHTSLPQSVLAYGLQANSVQDAQDVVDALTAATDECREAEHELVSTDVPAVGDAALAWTFEATEADAQDFRLVVVRRGDVLAVLVASGQPAVPADAQDAIARAVDTSVETAE